MGEIGGADEIHALAELLGALGVTLHRFLERKRDPAKKLRIVARDADDFRPPRVVIEHQEHALLRIREELHPLLEDAPEHVLETQLAVDDLDDAVERLQLARLRADLVGAREDEVLESPVLSLELAHAPAVRGPRRGDDDDEVREHRPPAQPRRRRDRELIRERLGPHAVGVARLHFKGVSPREQKRGEVRVPNLGVRRVARPVAVVSREPRAEEHTRLVAERERRVFESDVVLLGVLDASQAHDRRDRVRFTRGGIEDREAAGRAEVDESARVGGNGAVGPRLVVEQSVGSGDVRNNTQRSRVDFHETRVVAHPDA